MTLNPPPDIPPQKIGMKNATGGWPKSPFFFGPGFFFRTPGHEALPSANVRGNSIFSNFFASIVGAFMYFATLTEVPILQGLLGAGMGKGPALALLLAGPALSLPSMLVIRTV
ncbi:permease [Acetomicrobium sp.]|uniref:permease n=1 Tax=Acetomicrobium sp. TaxID=1872099 RepID=UPI002870C6F5|nr:permease [Acetomicrobium sp.]MDR9770077.1 permease [Acetomicrobium sp.]